MFRGFFFAVLLQVRGLWKRASLETSHVFDLEANRWMIVESLEFLIYLVDLFQHLEKPPGDRFHKALTITRLSTTLLPILWNERLRVLWDGVWFHTFYLALEVRETGICHTTLLRAWMASLSCQDLCCFCGTAQLPWNLQCQETAFTIRLANQTLPFAFQKNMPQTPKEPACGSPSEHDKGVRTVTSQLLDLQIQRFYHFNTPNFCFTDPKIYKDCRMHQE